ncbi:Gfo/Idh/MocA family protein [Tautonia plasticadhaerens]|uniref:Putative oxidoreductase YdgJ n=1 Tax=Tautonia plasticadhaerens TaxID=2527974 RepID=A0A518HDJ5_9BACT|nr:Gfo/Idh/MocA family oxidoreductase [Tautonia plasticadhaerens]QDV38910.1 putative oxidoreductase YdgJ [Tautonia plasticadhaerens]
MGTIPGRPTRRSVLKGSMAAAGGALAMPWIVPASALGRQEGVRAASERITMGVIGFGPRCTYVMKAMLPLDDMQCVTVCDVQKSRREAGKKVVDEHYGNADCTTTAEFRELFDRPDLDALLIATGDRWHAPASMMAARAGKDVYSEKPCGLTIELCQQVDETFRETGRVFQAGTQRRSVANFQKAVELARAGKLGTIKTLYASVYRPTLDNAWLPGQPTPPEDECDWDRWLGPAPWRPYNQDYVQGRWRGYWDFDSGARLLDWAAHTLDLCQQAKGADDTMPVEYEPAENRITCRYEDGVEIVLDFLDDPFGDRKGWINELGTCPVRFVGDEGWVETGDNGGIVVEPASLRSEVEDFSSNPQVGLDVGAHAKDWFEAIRTRGTTAANSSIMRHSHIACHAAALSWVLGRTLRIDPDREEFLDDPEANGLRSRAAREPYAT